MQNEYSKKTRDILNQAIDLSNSNNISTVGSEYLILAMYDAKDSLCHFILDEYDVTREEILETTNEVFIIRKKLGATTGTLDTILHQAMLLSGNKPIEEEHIFMAILMNPTCIAANILTSLGLDIETLILDVKEIYEFETKEEMQFTKNITTLAKKNELTPFIGRKDLLEKMDLILHRRTKSNPLLIGNAGVGKTALVEGYASLLNSRDSELEIISLNLTSMLAGTKYRGDFEQRFDDFSKKIITKKNVILFIDEIHTIMGAGTTEGNLDIANMLKPYLARSEVKIIGATTLEEYHKTMENDKALCRRFQPIYVLEPTLEETKDIMYGIKESYCNYHQVTMENSVLDYIIEESNRRIPLRSRPDKCIDILDDVLTFSKLNKITPTKDDVNKAISRFIGCKESNEAYNCKYPQLSKYSFLSEANLLFSNALLKIKYVGKKDGMQDIISDCLHLFKASSEMVLELDFQEFSDSFMTSSLIGAPPGYVGYEEEGILTKHLSKYQIPILCIYNFDYASSKAKSILMHVMEKGELYDSMGRLIRCGNAIYILQCKEDEKHVGFTYSDEKKKSIFDEVIYSTKENVLDLTSQYRKRLQEYNIELASDMVITMENKKEVDDKIFSYIKNGKIENPIVIK